MELSEFVKDTLTEIAQGVNEAREEYVKIGGDINTKARCCVKFNIALNQIDKAESGKGIGVVLPSLKIGANKTDEQTSSAQTRVEFEVVVKLP